MLHLFNHARHYNIVEMILKIERMKSKNNDDNNSIDMTSTITYISDKSKIRLEVTK
jgi:hypothetical protein